MSRTAQHVWRGQKEACIQRGFRESSQQTVCRIPDSRSKITCDSVMSGEVQRTENQGPYRQHENWQNSQAYVSLIGFRSYYQKVPSCRKTISKESQWKYSWAPECVAIAGNTRSSEIVHHCTLSLGSYIEERCIQDLSTCTDDTGSTCGWTNALSKAGCRLHHHCRAKEHNAEHNICLTFPSFAHRNVVCRLSSLTLCPDVHRPVAVNLQAVSDDRALFTA